MTDEPLDEVYFKWLVVQVVNTRLKNPNLTNWHVLRQLFTTEFLWRVPNDDNRVADGQELRLEFLEIHLDEPVTQDWLVEGCSFLEMLIALSRKLAFQTEGASAAIWFWHMMDNVQLRIFDTTYELERMEGFVGQVLQCLIDRTYDKNGKGGLFPLRDTDQDQTRVEIWYQLNHYLLERS